MDSQPNNQPGNGSGAKEGQQQIPPPGTVIPPAPPGKIPTQEQQQEKKGFFEKYKHEMEFLGIVGLAFYCIVNWLEWRTFDSERLIMENEFRESQKNSIESERAWVLVNGQIEVTISEKNDTARIVVTYKNTGKTPAIKVQSVTIWTDDAKTIPTKDGIPSNPACAGLLAPGQTGFSETTPFPIQIVNDIATGKTIYVYGTTWYDDIFGGHHWSQFCYRVERDAMNSKLIDFRPLTIHNSCDAAEYYQKH